jgi:hypothetical protein
MNKMANTVLQDVSQKPDTKMGRLLLESGKISSADFKLIMDTQALRGLRFGDAALELGLANTADIKAILAQQFAYPGIPDSNSKLDKRFVRIVCKQKHCAVYEANYSCVILIRVLT